MGVNEKPLNDLGAYPLSEKTRQFLAKKVLGHYLNGQIVASISGEENPLIEPGSGKAFARVASGNVDDIDVAVNAAREAYEDGRWCRLTPAQRERCLRKLAELIEDNRDILSDLDILEGGATRSYSGFMVQLGIEIVNYYAGWPTKIQGGIPATSSDIVVQEVREPVGVCGVITPWNGPSCIPLSIIPALACGNSVVLKPAEQTPLAALFVAGLCSQAGIPDGVLNVIQGFGHTAGAALVAHPLVDSISFTGSVETGRKIQIAAAGSLKRLTLELGGKSPQIIFADADLDVAVPTVAAAIFSHAGQVCVAGSRVLVQRSIYNDVVERLIGLAGKLKIGSGFDSTSDMGPLVSQMQLDRVCHYVKSARDEGATLAFGGERQGSEGFYHQPTIFTGVDNSMTIAQEEVFGPVVVVMPFDTEAEALAIANQTEYGLAAGVWTRNLACANRSAKQLRAGTVWVNTYLRVDPGVSFGGVKHSGVGRNLGHASIEELTQVKSIWFDISSG